MGLDDTERELYSSGGPRERESRYKARKRQEPPPEDLHEDIFAERWDDPGEAPMANRQPANKKRRTTSRPRSGRPFPIKKIAAATVVLVIVGGIFAFRSYIDIFDPDTRGAAVVIDGPSEVLLGVPFAMTVKYANESQTDIRSAEIDLAVPSGISVIGSPDQNVITRSVGSLAAGEMRQETFDLIALEGEKTAQTIKALLRYSAEGVSSRFTTKEAPFIVNVGEAGLRLDVVYPNKTLNGEEFAVEFSYANVSQSTFDNVRFVLESPDAFEFLHASPPPSATASVWQLGAVLPGASEKIAVSGRIFGQEGSFFSLTGKLIISYQGQDVTISTRGASLAIASSPLSLDVTLGDAPDTIARPGENLRYTIAYRNNTEVGLQDVVIKAQLAGEMFDMSALQTGAFFESITNTITWNAATARELALIPAGGSGAVSFSIRTKDAYPIKRLNDKDFLLRVSASIESPTVPFFVGSDKTTGFDDLSSRIAGEIKIDAKALFRDAPSGMLNQGPIPPKANVPTQYTVHWNISTLAADFGSVEVRAFFESGVRWTGQVKSSIPGSVPSFNERTSEVVWVLDTARANSGTVGDPITAVFQIEATPSILDIGKHKDLMGGTKLTATDKFVGMSASATDGPLTTQLQDDPTVTEGRVVQ